KAPPKSGWDVFKDKPGAGVVKTKKAAPVPTQKAPPSSRPPTPIEKYVVVHSAEDTITPSEVVHAPVPKAPKPRAPYRTPPRSPADQPSANLDTRYRWAVGGILDPHKRNRRAGPTAPPGRQGSAGRGIEAQPQVETAAYRPPLTTGGKIDFKELKRQVQRGNPGARAFVAARTGRSFGGLVSDVV